MDVVRKIIELLSRRQRLHLGLLSVAVLVMAFLEMLSVASVLPFLAVAADPGKIQTNAWLSWAYDALGFASTNGFLLVLAAAALLALVVSNAWMAATQLAQLRFSWRCSHSLAVRLLQHYLAQPYAFFLRQNSADLSKNILAEAEKVTAQVLMPCRRVGAKTVVALAIVALLVVFDPFLAFVVATVLGGAYGAIYLYVRRRLTRLGKERLAANRARYKAASEAFGAIKDIKLLGKEGTFLARFTAPSECNASAAATVAIIGDIPRYALEVLAFGGVLVIAIYLMLRGEELQQAIPVLGLYAFAGYRLMPAAQHVFLSYTRLSFGAPALANLHRELIQALPRPSAKPLSVARANGHVTEILPLTRRFELDAVSFTYPGVHRPALRNATLTVEANTTVGIIGPTGSGKTTLVDIILGLLRPQAGEIRIDDMPLTDANLRAWQNSLGYVPQHIYLSDDTIAHNIAFGISDPEIDRGAVERAAQIANIHGFITRDLPEGYDTVVGERGIRLSGGQRQRIGIARALYHEPSMLVFDEATSALDNDTEAVVMEAIKKLAGTRTILMIAHRVTTLRACEAIHNVEAGRLIPAQSSVRLFEGGPLRQEAVG